MIEISKFKTNDTALINKAYAIRNVVFVIEQEVDEREEYDEFEDESIHFLVSIDNNPVATARWRTTDNGIKLERFAVLKDYRGKGMGLKILKAVISDLPKTEATVYLHAQVQVTGFYKKVGFNEIGDEFVEANIRHYKMTL
ncbi:MAG: putative GNAT family N-acyltransferase [Flavobacteriales bacterium]|jgi:predicted GNAT family N-acyltransferase